MQNVDAMIVMAVSRQEGCTMQTLLCLGKRVHLVIGRLW